MIKFSTHYFLAVLLLFGLGLSACSPSAPAATPVPPPALSGQAIQPGFTYADGTRPLSFPADFGAHPDFRTEWRYYTGNLQTAQGRRFGFELTIFRVGLLPPGAALPAGSSWYSRELYFAHLTVSDISSGRFYSFERYSRPGPGLAGAQAEPYRVWLEDWNITGGAPGGYRLQARQADAALDLNLNDEMGVILQGRDGYSRKGVNVTDASYYYSQPRLGAARAPAARAGACRTPRERAADFAHRGRQDSRRLPAEPCGDHRTRIREWHPHALHLALEGAGGGHCPQPRGANRGDGASRHR